MRSVAQPVSVSLVIVIGFSFIYKKNFYTHHLIIIIQSVYCSVLLYASQAAATAVVSRRWALQCAPQCQARRHFARKNNKKSQEIKCLCFCLYRRIMNLYKRIFSALFLFSSLLKKKINKNLKIKYFFIENIIIMRYGKKKEKRK